MLFSDEEDLEEEVQLGRDTEILLGSGTEERTASGSDPAQQEGVSQINLSGRLTNDDQGTARQELDIVNLDYDYDDEHPEPSQNQNQEQQQEAQKVDDPKPHVSCSSSQMAQH